MAIIDSVLVGKGRGKIGNVVLQGIKGQTVAKQLNPAPANPRTIAQTDSRNQMANTVMAWQFLSVFFAFAGALRKPLESTYNAFVRLFKNSASLALLSTRAAAAQSALISYLFTGNWIQITELVDEDSVTKVIFNTGGLPFIAGSKLRVIGIDLSGQAFTIGETDLTEAMWSSGKASNPIVMPNYDTVAAYIYTADQSKISSLGVLSI